MKKLNFDYNLYDANGVLLQKGHINYSISHFIYVQYQKTYLRYAGKTMPSPQHFWNNFNATLNIKNTGNMFFAFVNNQPQFLNKTSKVGAMQIMQAFGYFAFCDIVGAYPIFVRSNKRVYLEEPSSHSGMSFHFDIPQKQPTKAYHKLFMSTFVSNGTMSLVNEQGTFSLKIVDPTGSKGIDDTAAKSYFDNKNKVLEDLNGTKEFSVKNENINLTVYISKTPIDELDERLDGYTDGEIYIYVKENLKVSKYIHFIEDEALAISLRTASLVKFDKPKYDALKNGDVSAFNAEEIQQLKSMMFIVSSNDEYLILQENRKKAFGAKNNKLGFTILTTTKCNARCPYCFESGIKQVAMSKSIQQKISHLICAETDKKIHISWFGGEPLLNADAIDFITECMREKGMTFSESLVTNGYLIDKYIENFSKWNINNVQITLDGVDEKYDNVKKFIYNGKAFEKIIYNIGLLLKNNITVAIRLNFSKNNYQDIIECVEYIYKTFGNDKNLRVYAHYIFGESYYLDDGTNLHIPIFKKLIDCGYVSSLEDLGLKSKTFFCFINDINHSVIDPEGNLYLCEHIANDNKEKCVGNIYKGITDISCYKYWSNIQYPYKKCQTCHFVYFCQGGCKNEVSETENSCCIPFIDSINEIVKYYYLNKKRRGINGDNRKT